MRVGGIVRTSCVDYPGVIAAVVFTQGCNLHCSYCHNRALMDVGKVTGDTTDTDVLAWLGTRQGLLDAVVVSGGEPTLQPDLADFIAEVRALGYLVKLDTNGTQPDVLASLLDKGLLDYVAMDVKAPVEEYELVCGGAIDQGAIDASIGLLLHARMSYEFRTTVLPSFTRGDLLAIGRRIAGAGRYVLQRSHPVESVAALGMVSSARLWHDLESLQGLLTDLRRWVMRCTVRGG